jgi:hypothetical protein
MYINISSISTDLLQDDHVQYGQIGTDDATADRLSLALTDSAGSVAAQAITQQQADASVGKNTLLHGEALLVVTAGDAENLRLSDHSLSNYTRPKLDVHSR